MSERYTHIVKRQSGYVAGWFYDETEAESFAVECNAAVPADPAAVEALDWNAWDAFVDEATTE